MATRKTIKKAAAGKKRKPAARKTNSTKRKVVAAKAKSLKSVSQQKSRKVAAAKSGVVKSTAKAPKKTAVKASSAAFVKTNKPVKPMRPRPLSPHLSIYRPQITSVLSIFHRGTGVVLYIAAFLVAGLLLCLGNSAEGFNAAIALLKNPVGCVAFYGLLFCLFYHFCNGIRHLAWDVGKGFELENVALSGLLVLVASLSLTIAICLMQNPQIMERINP